MGEIMAGISVTGISLAVIISIVEMFKRWVSYKEAALLAQGTQSDNRALEERVKVLERIVTESGYDVAARIEALRDQRRDAAPACMPAPETERA